MTNQNSDGARFAMLGYDVYDSSEKLGLQLYNFANENRENLLARGLIGFVNRYGGNPELTIEEGMEKAVQSADMGRFNHAKRISGHYLRFDEDGVVDCVGSVQAGLPLTKPVIPIMPTKISRRVPILTRDVEVDVNISAVTRYDNDRTGAEQLANCYRFLLDKTVKWVDQSKTDGFIAWTLLPRANFSVNGEIHRAISSAGMERVDIGRFDEGETRGVAPLSFLFTKSVRDESI